MIKIYQIIVLVVFYNFQLKAQSYSTELINEDLSQLVVIKTFNEAIVPRQPFSIIPNIQTKITQDNNPHVMGRCIRNGVIIGAIIGTAISLPFTDGYAGALVIPVGLGIGATSGLCVGGLIGSYKLNKNSKPTGGYKVNKNSETKGMCIGALSGAIIALAVGASDDISYDQKNTGPILAISPIVGLIVGSLTKKKN